MKLELCNMWISHLNKGQQERELLVSVLFICVMWCDMQWITLLPSSLRVQPCLVELVVCLESRWGLRLMIKCRVSHPPPTPQEPLSNPSFKALHCGQLAKGRWWKCCFSNHKHTMNLNQVSPVNPSKSTWQRFGTHQWKVFKTTNYQLINSWHWCSHCRALQQETHLK